MTAIRIFELVRDSELSKLARDILDGNEAGKTHARAHFYDNEEGSEEGEKGALGEDIATADPDVILVTNRDTESAAETLARVAEKAVPAPTILFTTRETKTELLRSRDFSAWDVVSDDEPGRLPVAILHASEAAEAHRRESRLRDEVAQAKALLLKNQKSITVGRLLGSIAHEINNPLEAVANLLYLAQRQTVPERDANECIAMAEKELQRVGDITRQMLSFHRESRTIEEVQVTGAIETGLALFETRLRHLGVSVERQYRSVGCLMAYAGELRQVFSNLFSNSVDAMPHGGRLIVRVQERLGERRSLCITLADTGVGMGRDVAKRVGDLFFTTKGETGTGLGMWVTRQLIEKHGGTMRVYSSTKPGRSGTVFRIVFHEPHARFKGALEEEAEQALWARSAERDVTGEDDAFSSEMMSA